jgi:hypothetical protein
LHLKSVDGKFINFIKIFERFIFTSQLKTANMSQIKTLKKEQPVTRHTIDSMVSAINHSLKTDMNLAIDMLIFLEEHGIQIPAVAPGDLQPLLITTYAHKSENLHLEQLRGIFEDVSVKENIL